MKKLHLSNRDRMIAGVCGGLGESTGINSGIFRAAFVVSMFIGGAGILIYLALLLILPRDTGSEIIDVEAEVEGDEKNTTILRSRSESMIAGVCGGLATYLHWDVSLLRILFIIMAFAGGVGAVIYLVLWFMFPLEDQ